MFTQTEVMVFKMYGISERTIYKLESLSFTPEQRKAIRQILETAYQNGRKDG